jgi:hypothetical protein
MCLIVHGDGILRPAVHASLFTHIIPANPFHVPAVWLFHPAIVFRHHHTRTKLRDETISAQQVYFRLRKYQASGQIIKSAPI